jgi:hypothetical protein
MLSLDLLTIVILFDSVLYTSSTLLLSLNVIQLAALPACAI